MESAYARRYLLRYLESEGQENLLLFWNAVNELRTCRKDLIHALGAEIYQTYLAGIYGVIRLDKVSRGGSRPVCLNVRACAACCLFKIEKGTHI